MKNNTRSVAIVIVFALTLSVRADEPAASTKLGPRLARIFQLHYTQRVQEFREQNQLFQNVILVGDSITEGFDVAKYLPGRRVINRGIGADVIGNDLKPDDKRGVLKRLDESFFNVPATDAFLLIGINDLGDNHTPEQLEAGYREILEKVKKRCAASQSARAIAPADARQLRQAQCQRERLQRAAAKTVQRVRLRLHRSPFTHDRRQRRAQTGADRRRPSHQRRRLQNLESRKSTKRWAGSKAAPESRSPLADGGSRRFSAITARPKIVVELNRALC